LERPGKQGSAGGKTITNLIFYALLRSVPALLTDSPVFLLAICPVLIVVGAVLPPPKGRRWLLAALLVLSVGTGGLFLATPGGRILDPHAHGSHATGAALWIYESLTMEVKIAFTGLTAVYIAVFLMPDLLHRRDSRLFSTVLRSPDHHGGGFSNRTPGYGQAKVICRRPQDCPFLNNRSTLIAKTDSLLVHVRCLLGAREIVRLG
jgi:hypothetical protein